MSALSVFRKWQLDRDRKGRGQRGEDMQQVVWAGIQFSEWIRNWTVSIVLTQTLQGLCPAACVLSNAKGVCEPKSAILHNVAINNQFITNQYLISYHGQQPEGCLKCASLDQIAFIFSFFTVWRLSKHDSQSFIFFGWQQENDERCKAEQNQEHPR